MEQQPQLKRNTLGGKLYVPKTEEQRKAEIAAMEAESRKRSAELKQKEETNG